MEAFVITCNPSDYPGKYVLRRHTVIGSVLVADVEPLYVGLWVPEARLLIPKEALRVPISPRDDPVLLECWIC
jgi:hypothetical protein